MSDLGSGAFNEGPRMVLVVYAVSETQCTKLLLEYIYDADKQLLNHNAHDFIIVPMLLLTKQMMNGNNYAKYTDAHGVLSFDTTVQITRIGFDDSQSVGSVESYVILDYDHVAQISACQDVSLGVRYDEQLIDRINANWDEELASTQDPSTWTTSTPYTELVYDENEWEHDPDGFFRARISTGKRYADE
jgi:hypothetical protein